MSDNKGPLGCGPCLITTDGRKFPVRPHDLERGWTLDELYALIRCSTIEMVVLGHGGVQCDLIPDNWILIGDEEGRLIESPELNYDATMLWLQSWTSAPVGPQAETLRKADPHGELLTLVGDFILCPDEWLK